ncbi:helicase-related protein [Terribacillus saccharophilus]|uniref:helicase-related protein n=1 Tax=Terribacillus saccharophilus TaxID=361277 RepID=UPI0037FADA81
MNQVQWDLVSESTDSPKMIEIYLDQAWQDAYCYSLAVEETESQARLLFAIISGSDSTLQAMKAAVDIGSNGLYFGHGVKGLSQFSFEKEFQFCSDKGKYEKFPITLSNGTKALAIVHDKVLSNEEYILSFGDEPAEDLRQILGGGQYGLHILPEWKDCVYQELILHDYLERTDFYKDPGLFQEGFTLLRLRIVEHEADALISKLIKAGKLQFPQHGKGENLHEVVDLNSYMTNYVDDMIEKISAQVLPTHNPMIDKVSEHFSSYKRELFPVQAHVSTAIAKRLKHEDNFIIQGEMSTGKTTMLAAIADAYHKNQGKKGYFSCVMVPPSLTKKWPEEIKEIIPGAIVHVITKTESLIRYHSEWIRNGKVKPVRPTFFVISFTTMRGDSVYVPAVDFQDNKINRFGYYCPDCGRPHQVVESTDTQLNESGSEEIVKVKRGMAENEFGTSRRVADSKMPANAFCSECGGSLWTKSVPNRYSSFKEWAAFEKEIAAAISNDNPRLARYLLDNQKEIPKKKGLPRKIASIEYIRRKMKNFFDISLVDEIHELKSGMSAQGNCLGSLVACSKKVVGGTGTLFGGKAEDVYYLLWRLFPNVMVKNGYKFNDVRKWNEEFGNIETTTITTTDKGEYSNKQSRGGTKRSEKVLPGISPFVFGKFLVQNSALVRLVDVWPDPVELVNVPTILVEMDPPLAENYNAMTSHFENLIHSRQDGKKLYLPLTNTGISYPDNPFTYPDVLYKNELGEREIIWQPLHLPENLTLNKERKLQELVQGEMEQGRKSIIYVRDTGSSVEGRDVRPRLKTILEKIGAKVDILDTSSTSTNNRSEWLKNKVENEDHDCIIVSQELVKVGLDLLCTPTIIFYQFSWSLFTVNQASRRAWRIGQSEECRLYYLAYEHCYQEQMAQLIAMKNKAAGAINGEVSSDGLNAMLGDDGDLQSMLIKSIKDGRNLKGSTEEWVEQSSERAREILSGIGKKPSVKQQFIQWTKRTIKTESTRNVLIKRVNQIVTSIESGEVDGFSVHKEVLSVDLIHAFGFGNVPDATVLSHLVEPERELPAAVKHEPKTILKVSSKRSKGKKKNRIADGQYELDLFAL